MAYFDDIFNYILFVGLDEYHCDYCSIKGTWFNMDETSNFYLGSVCNVFLLVLAFPPLEAAAVMQLMDRVAGTSFFLPSGLVMSGEIVDVAGSGSPCFGNIFFGF